MNPWRRFRVASWYTKILIIGTLLVLIPILLAAFMFVISWLRWTGERNDLVTNLDQYYNYIQTAETRLETVVVDSNNGKSPTRIYDRNNTLIGEFMTDRKEVVPSRDIPDMLKKAVMAMEDAEFYAHNGINLKRLMRAFLDNIFLRRTVGGSTITQQLAKLLFTNREQTLQRKVFEFFGAKELESRFSKDDILLLYLNTVYFGHGAWGVEAASKLYFNKSVHALNVYECTLLAGIISRPESYSPMRSVDAAKLKHLQALARLVQVYPDVISRSVLDENFERFWQQQEKLLQNPNVSFWKMRVNAAPYFIEFIRQRLLTYFTDDEIISGGLRIYTTLDANMQRAASESVVSGLLDVEDAKERDIRRWLVTHDQTLAQRTAGVTNETALEEIQRVWSGERDEYLARYRKPVEAALVAMDSMNGYVLAMIGGSKFTFDNELNRAVFSKRQFGSSMKPFVYTAALEEGVVHAGTIVEDKRQTYRTPEGLWSPKNFDNQYRGNVSIRQAMVESINTVAVETISNLGPAEVASRLRKTFFNKRAFPAILSLPLGSVELSTLDAARIYSVFASGGYRAKPLFIRSILDNEGKTLYNFETGYAVKRAREGKMALPDTLDFDDDNAALRELVFEPGAVFIITDMMRDVLLRGTGAYARAKGGLAINAAAKSGTSDNNRDAWFSGFVRSTVAAVWVGFDDDKTQLPSTMTGGIAAGPIWGRFMAACFWGAEPYSFPRPANVITREICRETGSLAMTACPETYTEYFIEDLIPEEHCPKHKGRRVEQVQEKKVRDYERDEIDFGNR
ncbi:MAG: PBP1A family penicillin-binding protein [Spirochaetota bacterium]|jgi:penicillin-binding protein 1A|nr:PBP1A family penicillin-binding protein [Spirochaetota bacterium]